MATELEQAEARLVEIEEQLVIERSMAANIGMFKQTGDKQDRTVMQDLGTVYSMIKYLMDERKELQDKINRLSGVNRVQTRPVSTVRFR